MALAASSTPSCSRAGSNDWLAVTEAGVTYQPSESPLDAPGHANHWRWTGVGGAVRRVGSRDAVGPVLLGSYSEQDYTVGAGLRWEHSFGDRWSVLVTPGFAIQDLVKVDSDHLTGYFGEIGVSYRRWLTLAARWEGIRYRPENYLDDDPPFDQINGRVWRLDARVGRTPGAVAIGAAALVVVVVGVTQATDAR